MRVAQESRGTVSVSSFNDCVSIRAPRRASQRRTGWPRLVYVPAGDSSKIKTGIVISEGSRSCEENTTGNYDSNWSRAGEGTRRERGLSDREPAVETVFPAEGMAGTKVLR